MTAQSVGIFTIEFPDPYTLSYYNDKFVTLGSNTSFQYPITSNVQTLSAKNVERGNDPYGILYVPNLQSDDCINSEKDYVPANTTRLRNLPQGTDYALIGLLPWFSPSCVLEYFAAARTSPVKALLVYQPGESAAMPPTLNDPSWTLGDGGQWRSANNFPTYALAPVSGGIVMQQLGLYSGNITDAPHGEELASLFSPTDYVRLWATVNTTSGSQLPSLWVFLVIVLGLLILIIILTSLGMHIIQRRRRVDLQRRVISGEVDLEAIGVKRLTVPREFLEKLPLYTYAGPRNVADTEKTPPEPGAQAQNLPSPAIEAETGLKAFPISRRSSAPEVTTHQPGEGPLPTFSQPTCPICLDDFEPNQTQVRELPCRHIFHPDCVDTFLLSNSSLCPMCKASVLPSGYCPARITNVMVRRERIIRRMRARSTANVEVTESQGQSIPTPRQLPGPFGSLGNRMGGSILGRRVFSAPERSHTRPPDIEMAEGPPHVGSEIAPVPTAVHPNQPNETPPECTEPTTNEPSRNRAEWARQRALTLLGNRQVPDDEDDPQPQSRLRRGLRRVFPGFR
ncbi:hypothetical protein BDV96DRAFT_634379 [Lophiotrema nucula]|uniref:RING-type domain-containing protein n=1 Tax=Lophiotrema nucula TaxID=690887 RepID=A0A6A5Z1H2_9PLEO|nr:hypothetical protein BDV96DRAFT_634379 [Lophiotrema nucula]